MLSRELLTTRSIVANNHNNMRERLVERDRQALVESSTGSNNTYKIQWTKVGEMDVITRAQAEALARQAERNGARRGQALVASSMKNDPGWRTRMS
jgi:hypothetical protein